MKGSATEKQATIVVLSGYGTHDAPLCCYQTDRAQWSLWSLYEIVGESNYKAHRADVSILYHVEVSSCRVSERLFLTKVNTAVIRLHRS